MKTVRLSRENHAPAARRRGAGHPQRDRHGHQFHPGPGKDPRPDHPALRAPSARRAGGGAAAGGTEGGAAVPDHLPRRRHQPPAPALPPRRPAGRLDAEEPLPPADQRPAQRPALRHRRRRSFPGALAAVRAHGLQGQDDRPARRLQQEGGGGIQRRRPAAAGHHRQRIGPGHRERPPGRKGEDAAARAGGAAPGLRDPEQPPAQGSAASWPATTSPARASRPRRSAAIISTSWPSKNNSWRSAWATSRARGCRRPCSWPTCRRPCAARPWPGPR